MICYALSLLYTGILVDKYNTVYVLCTGLIASGLLLILFGCSHTFHYHYNGILLLLQALHGIVQATGWPACVVLIARYFRSNQGAVFGIWASNQCLGNIGGTLLIALLIKLEIGTATIFAIPAVSLFVIAGIILSSIKDRPISDIYTRLDNNIPNGTIQRTDSVTSNIELSTPSTPNSANKYDTIDHIDTHNHTTNLVRIQHIDVQPTDTLPTTAYPALSFIHAVRVRGVINLSCAHAFTKYVNYTCFFWLPYYLFSYIGFSAAHSDTMSTIYDIGSIIGSTSAGYFSDKLHLKMPVICLYALLSCAAIALYDTFQPVSSNTGIPATSDLYAAVVMLCSGILIGGPAGLIPSACTADLCNNVELKSSTGTITGIVDGFGSIGGGLGPVIVAYISVHYGWSYVFILMTVSMVCSIVSMSSMLYDDVRIMLGYTKPIVVQTNGHNKFNGKYEEPHIVSNDKFVV